MTFFTSHQTIERMNLPARKIMRVSMDYISILMFCSSLLLIFVTGTSTTIDTVNTTQSIRDGDTMVSAGGSFELGFFSPRNSENRYLGIWYHKISVMTVVWVANRDTPLNDSSGVLRITEQGNLVLVNRSGGTIWSSNSSRPVRNPVVQLLDSGNLVVKEMGDDNLENSVWQSFDYPGDTFLPGMKVGRDIVRGLDWYISSWRTPDDPSTGNFTLRMNPGGFPETMVREDSIVRYRFGPWNGLRFSGVPHLKPNPIFTYGFVMNKKEVYYSYQLTNSSLLSRIVLNQNGLLQRFVWITQTQGWELYLTVQTDNCDRYALCGAYGSCNINNFPVCDCLKGFAPRIEKDWDMMDWSGGCVRKTPLNCSGDGFRKYSGVKLPETGNSWYNNSMNLEECKTACLKNCSCTAYANTDIREGGNGCLLWFNDLIDIRRFIENETDLYVRMAATELDDDDDMKISAKSNRRKQMKIMLISILPTGMLVLGMALVLLVRRKKKQKNRTLMEILKRSSNDDYKNEDQELQLFDLDTMAYATNNFSISNKLGEGGFGPVYKGVLKDGQEIAVKRLSTNSSQGVEEFKNEITHIAKLQHRNLVKLLGCCIQADERMLIYEFMPNKSLDNLIFDQTQRETLDWPTRHHIINGIVRGLLYLHQDSRLRIVHRDLKASNILLDYDMNPKISDFGMARCFGGHETEANTNKVVGTYGYISPEYAIDGLYSVKSDVFSFGVMVLEIVSGNRNRGFRHSEHHLNLLGHAWRLFKEGRSLELIASSIVECCNLSEVLRSIHVGLLCVQCNPNDRPSMSTVVLMLCGDGALPQPKQPGFFTDRNLAEANNSSRQNTPCSVNEFTITQLEAR